MSIKLRFSLLLGVLLAGLLAGMISLQWLERRTTRGLREESRQTRARELGRWLDLVGRSLGQTAGDLAQSEELSRLAAQPSADIRAKLAAELARNNVGALWLLHSGGDSFFHVEAEAGATGNRPPLDREAFAALVSETPNPRFFAEQGRDLFEICIRRFSVAGAEPAWLLVARRWDEALLRGIASLAEGSATLAAASDIAHAPPDEDRIVLLRPLNDWQGRTVRVLRLEYDDPASEAPLQTDTWQARIFIVFGLLVLVAIGLALEHWVLKPLRQIGASLAQDDVAPIRDLRKAENEFGRVARLVESSFAQRAELRRTIEERARLGRDLHDGVIQSLYAAGMGLASVRTLLPPGQYEADARIEQTRAALNETIRDVRNFITGLEPEALKQRGFTHAVSTLLDYVRTIRPVLTSTDIDESVAVRLTLPQRVHALQITREAVSNAVRHGEARHVWVSLRAHDSAAEFEVRDDGKGFDPDAGTSAGQGLGNFARRAGELGAEFLLDSAPGRGTRIRLVFPLTA